MPKLDSYLLRELAQSTFAVLVVLMVVSLGGVFADVLGDIARGKVPAGLMLSQLGLQVLNYLPLILPLGVLLGVLLAVGRLYRDSEMPVLTSIGVGPRRLLRPVLGLLVPMALLVALCSMWLGPWARDYSQRMIERGNRSLLIAGLEAGRFVELPGGRGVVYVGGMSGDGSHMARVFVYQESPERMDVTTAATGHLTVRPDGERFLTLEDGFRVEGPQEAGLDYRLMRFAANELLLPEAQSRKDDESPELQSTAQLLRDDRPQARAELHFRLAPPLLTLAFGLLAVPLARSPPRQARYGRIATAFLGYFVAVNLMLMGQDWLAKGKIAPGLGLWWLVLPVLVLGVWAYACDGRVRRWRRAR